LKLTRDGATAYVTLGAANRVAVVDGKTKEVRDYILVGSRPWDMMLSRDESRLFVVNGTSDDITIVDTKAGTVVRSVPVGRSPHSVAIDD
jgi:YVTN family beta-propeller protein